MKPKVIKKMKYKNDGRWAIKRSRNEGIVKIRGENNNKI